MQCEICFEEDATVHLTIFLDGNFVKVEACEACVQVHRANSPAPLSIAALVELVNKAKAGRSQSHLSAKV